MTPKEVARYISPFILRRKKEEVLPDLPDLIEVTHQSELSDDQKAIYLAQLQQMQQGLILASDHKSIDVRWKSYQVLPVFVKSVIHLLYLWIMLEIVEK